MNRRYRAFVPDVDDLAAPLGMCLSPPMSMPLGEVREHPQDVERAVNAIAGAGHVILGPGVEPVTEEDF